MATPVEKLNRRNAMRENMDPFGNVWGISIIEGTALYVIGKAPEDIKGAVVVPESYPHVAGDRSGMEGRFTRPDYAQKAIEEYLKRIWDHSDEQEKRSRSTAKVA